MKSVEPYPARAFPSEQPLLLRSPLEELRRLETVIPVIVSGRPLAEVLAFLTESAVAAAGASMGSIYLLDPQDRHLSPGAICRLPADYAKAYERFPVGLGACGRAVETGAPCVIADVQTAPLSAGERDIAMRNGIRSLFSVPIIAGEHRVLGALANHFPIPHQPTGEDIQRNLLYAHLAAAAIETARVVEETAARAAAEAELRMRDLFIGILAHDLRTPLSAISAGAAYLREQVDLPDSHARVAERIATSAMRMGRMIRQLIDANRSRRQEGFPIARQPVDLHTICRQVIDEMTAAHPGCVFALHTTGSGRGMWDPDRLAQVVSNLLGNAVQHGSHTHPIAVAVHGRGSRVILTVTNAGAPIASERLAKIFEPFWSSLHRSAGAGLGLGLYIGRQIVLAHGGRIHARSSAGTTTFQVELPREGA